MKYGGYSNGAWVVETIATDSGLAVAFVLDEQGTPHIAYANSPRITYATREPSGAWIKTVLPTPQTSAICLALDSAGEPHVVVGYPLRHVYRSGGVWTAETLEDIGKEVACAMSSDDLLHIVAAGENRELFAFTQTPGGAWTRELVDDGFLSHRVGWAGIRMALDDEGTPHVTYAGWSGAGMFPNDPTRAGDLRYATRTSAGWSVQIVDNTGDTAADGPSIALDARGDPHVVYHYSWLTSPSFEETYNGGFRYAAPAHAMTLNAADPFT